MLHTERLEIRKLAPGDLADWLRLLADPEVTRLLHFPAAHTPEQSAELLARTIERADGDVAMYAVLTRDGGDTVGFVGYAPRRLEWGDEVELGWTLFREFQGLGYATEAARAIRALVPGRVISLIRIENTASQNVARKIGMEHERDITHVGFATQLWASEA